LDGEIFYSLAEAKIIIEAWRRYYNTEGTGLATWSRDDIVTFLKTGRNHRTAAFGSMADVVQHSTQYMSDDDLTAMASYLKSLEARPGRSPVWEPKEDVTTAALRDVDFTAPGALSYV